MMDTKTHIRCGVIIHLTHLSQTIKTIPVLLMIPELSLDILQLAEKMLSNCLLPLGCQLTTPNISDLYIHF